MNPDRETKKLRLIFDLQPNIVVITDGKKIVDANSAFLKFFNKSILEEFTAKNDCICDFFIQDESNRYLKKIYPDGTTWVDLVLNEADITHKAMILDSNGQKKIFEVKGSKLVDEEYDYMQDVVVFTDITTIENQSILISNMEIPILDISDTTVLVPLIGILDSVKSQKLMENMLASIKQKNIKTAIVDIEGIVIVDSAVAAHFIKITKATRLMGCTTILSGIAPEVAQTIVNLGINLEGINTTSTLKDALKLALTFK
jgi:rsbT co-antagonist protein RsbR